MRPSVKFVLAIIDSISKKKMGVNFFIRKKTIPGGGGPRGGLAKNHKKYVFFPEPFPWVKMCQNWSVRSGIHFLNFHSARRHKSHSICRYQFNQPHSDLRLEFQSILHSSRN